ncbi:hypothetical protein O0I10_003930 [Lichtheimia ornata]|uniref:Uncharacterized protein n=1 Tax=Lichtheimia ornata TaxID=688661 RepID=A0AAD7Y2F1_9FUNG|nr:uncharacterized protein O0I10_003930 [Lichtheimia ornata]KAJ8660472.1 hypothetical protein O0I10_003930 [Lichtheimia ornata]
MLHAIVVLKRKVQDDPQALVQQDIRITGHRRWRVCDNWIFYTTNVEEMMTTLMKMVLPYGKAKVVKQHLKSLKFSFALTHEEASLIARIQQNYEAMTATQRAVLLWKQQPQSYTSSLESWWRIFVYGPMFDTAFMLEDNCTVVRSESESQTYKDGIVSKDTIPMNASTKSIDEAVCKNKSRRVATIKAIEYRLPQRRLINHFEALTALWHG